eukprot:14500560-Alexandrium_andersonii.AAC.1
MSPVDSWLAFRRMSWLPKSGGQGALRAKARFVWVPLCPMCTPIELFCASVPAITTLPTKEALSVPCNVSSLTECA